MTSFDGQGYARAIAGLPDGRFVVGGSSKSNHGHVFGVPMPGSTPADFVLARYEPNGTLDESFGSGGRVRTDFEGWSDELDRCALRRLGALSRSARACRSIPMSKAFR
jgi:hypothetical protein